MKEQLKYMDCRDKAVCCKPPYFNPWQLHVIFMRSLWPCARGQQPDANEATAPHGGVALDAMRVNHEEAAGPRRRAARHAGPLPRRCREPTIGGKPQRR